MADEISKYQAALRKQTEAAKKATEVLAPTRSTGGFFCEWWKVLVSEESLDTPRMGVIASQHLARKNWPTFDQMSQAIKEWNGAVEEVFRAWEAIAPDDRVGLVKPEKDPPQDYR